MPTQLTPAQAWQQLKDGNSRFVNGTMEHPSQGFEIREQLKVAQNPFATFFGCSDSRVAAEIIFDRGLGDLFVVRTAGHTVDTTVVGSIEYAVEVLHTPLIVVLGHDKCGAVHAAAQTLATGEQPPGFIRAVTDRVIPSIVAMTATPEALDEIDEALLRTVHVKHTAEMLHGYSAAIAAAVAEGRCAIIGLEYDLEDGAAHLIKVIGDIGEE
ncbi:carbonic anhydrase [Timonella senegalensis]|uniref:carbonic anhydrase n=1 Tax=Timonella senegalensis TaxID=1465825 RepID=UPI0003110107|nr:carbonic anhydrase [Timonella senegalensis]